MSQPIKAVSGQEYEVKKQGKKLKTFASILSILWIALITVPLAYVVFLHSNDLRNYLVIKGVYTGNKYVMSQYTDLTSKVVNSINLEKHLKKIKVPEIKVDGITDLTSNIQAQTKKVTAAAKPLSKLGVKPATEVAEAAEKLTREVGRIETQVTNANKQIESITAEAIKVTTAEINKALKEEMDKFASTQVQKLLKLSDRNYANLIQNKYGVLTEKERSVGRSIYAEFEKNDPPLLKYAVSLIHDYYKYIVAAFVIIAIVISAIPIWLLWKIVGMFTKNFTQCPYCKKIFLSSDAKLSILSFLKFW